MKYWRPWKFAVDKQRKSFADLHGYFHLKGTLTRDFFLLTDSDYQKAINKCKDSIPTGSKLSIIYATKKIFLSNMPIGRKVQVAKPNQVTPEINSVFDKVVVF